MFVSVAISSPLFARHFPFFVASQFFPFPFILSLTVFRSFLSDSISGMGIFWHAAPILQQQPMFRCPRFLVTNFPRLPVIIVLSLSLNQHSLLVSNFFKFMSVSLPTVYVSLLSCCTVCSCIQRDGIIQRSVEQTRLLEQCPQYSQAYLCSILGK